MSRVNKGTTYTENYEKRNQKTAKKVRRRPKNYSPLSDDYTEEEFDSEYKQTHGINFNGSMKDNIEYLEDYLTRLKKLEGIRMRKIEMLSKLRKTQFSFIFILPFSDICKTRLTFFR